MEELKTAERLSEMLEKIRTIEKSNSDEIVGVLMNPMGNYYMPCNHDIRVFLYILAVSTKKCVTSDQMLLSN